MRITRAGHIVALGVALGACGQSDHELLAPEGDPTPALGAPAEGPYAAAEHPSHARTACVGQRYRQFDFWAGQWNIQNPSGALTSTSVVSRELDGCVVMEDFIANGGYHGRSLNIYDDRDRRWYQSFVDNTTGNYRLTGGLEGTDMVMHADQTAFIPGFGILQRTSVVTWSPLSGGRVHQFFDESFNGGPAFRTFDGLYLPTDSPDRATPNNPGFCETAIPGSRQLDFWVGDWTVATDESGELGRSTVTSELAGCLIEENFVSSSGLRSRSFLFYDFTVDTWFRTYADNTGDHYELSGGLEDGRVVLVGDERLRNGRTARIRVTLEPVGGGVTQTVEVSEDGGATWTTVVALAYSSADP